MNCSMPDFPVLHYHPDFAQTHVHWVSDAIQPSHPLSPPSPLAFNLSQHQNLFQWVGSSNQVAKVSELQLQHQSIQRIFRTNFLSRDCHHASSIIIHVGDKVEYLILFLIELFSIGMYLIYDVVLVLGVQLTDSVTHLLISIRIHSFSDSFPTDFCIASLSLTLMIICVLLIIPLIAAIFLSIAKFDHVIPQLRSLRWHSLCPNSCFPKCTLEIQDVWASVPGKRYSMSNKLEK